MESWVQKSNMQVMGIPKNETKTNRTEAKIKDIKKKLCTIEE